MKDISIIMKENKIVLGDVNAIKDSKFFHNKSR